ncbi:MAG: TerB family tellurite resistance protein [Dongiaceae bacterium]
MAEAEASVYVAPAMAIWGKILGGAAGFAVGGPLGALLGAAAGHAVDAIRDGGASDIAVDVDDRAPTRQIAFTIAVIVLGAKMAKADGVVTREEIVAFRQVFQVPPEEIGHVGRLFDRAREDPDGFEPYARQIARLFPAGSRVLEELIDGLFHIAKADGTVSPDELDFLRAVAGIFGFPEAEFQRIREGHLGPDMADPYAVLGVTRASSDKEIKIAWRKLIRETHPDRLIAEGLPQEFIDLATRKVAVVNAAYDQISKERNIV